MINRQFSRKKIKNNMAFATALAGFNPFISLMGLPGFAPLQPQAIAAPAAAPVIQFKPPAGLPPAPVVNDPDGRGQGGGSRGCNQSGMVAKQPLFTVLVPPTPTQNGNKLWGLTTTDHPSFWLQTHQELKHGALVAMTLQGINHRSRHTIQFQVPQTRPGVLRFTPPADTPPLVIGETYHWTFTIYCNSGNTTTTDPSFDLPETIRGGIQRLALSPDLQRQLAAAKTPLDQATIYAKHGIWYDSLTSLGLQLQGKTTVDPAIARAWAALLRQGNLDATATMPIVSCCLPK